MDEDRPREGGEGHRGKVQYLVNQGLGWMMCQGFYQTRSHNHQRRDVRWCIVSDSVANLASKLASYMLMHYLYDTIASMKITWMTGAWMDRKMP